MYRCEYCNTSFPTFFSLRSHKNVRMKEGIPYCARVDSGTIYVSADDSDDVPMHSAAAAIIAPIFLQHEICQRHQSHAELGSPCSLSNVGESADNVYTGSTDYGALVQAFHSHSLDVLNSRATKFWKMFLATRNLPQDEQRQILLLVKKLFLSGAKKGWCADKRAVRNLLYKKPFWPLATYAYTCDLRKFDVPGLGVVTYKFVDPIFAWIMQARKLCKRFHLLFLYRETRKKCSGEQTWGSCVSCGGAMSQVNYCSN